MRARTLWRSSLLILTLALALGCDDEAAGDEPPPAPDRADAVAQPVAGGGGDVAERPATPESPDPAGGWGEDRGGEAGSGGDGWGGYDAASDAGVGPSSGAAGGMGADEGGEPQPWRREGDGVYFASVDVGDGETLLLESMRVSVQVEGLRASTLVDHVFHNPHGQALEGTFRYPLPPGATVSYYAMFMGAEPQAPEGFGDGEELEALPPEARAKLEPEGWAEGADGEVWGELRVGRVAPAEQARQVYEDVTRRRVDPALVEEVAPNTFEARVFPIPAHGYNRVMIAYEETLPRVGDQLRYGFAVPPAERGITDFSLISAAELSPVGDLEVAETLPGLHQAHLDGPHEGGAFAFDLPAGPEAIDLTVGVDPVDGQTQHFYARLQAPDLSGEGHARPRAVFLLDTSYSADPDRFNVDVALLEAILNQNAEIEAFAVVTFDVGARLLTDGFVDNTPEAREAALRALDGVLLEGATDLGAALRLMRDERLGGGDTDAFLLTDGALSWGDLSIPELSVAMERSHISATRFFAYRTGLGAENGPLFAALTRGGATFNCLTSDSVPACAVAHTHPGLSISGVEVVGVGEAPAAVEELVVAGRQATLFPGAELILAGRLTQPGAAEIRVTGRLDGEPLTLTWPAQLEGSGQLASRAWAEIVIAQLLETSDEALERVAVALSQRYTVISRATSLLVLETDEEYTIYGLEELQVELDWRPFVELIAEGLDALGDRLDRWDAVLDALADAADLHQTPEEVLDTLRGVVDEEALSLPVSDLVAPLVYAEDAPAYYLEARSHVPSVIDAFEAEASRRAEADDVPAAARALASVVENSPADAEALRLVAYRLLGWGEDAAAAGLLLEVLRRRPYEPQSYRDLARALSESRPALAALLYEAMLSGEWSERFLQLQVVAGEEYALLISQEARRNPEAPLTAWLLERKLALGIELPRVDLRVTITWNTDNTDVDLWVTDPGGEKCYYGNPNNAMGGALLADVTQGFGPERFEDREANPGRYLIEAHYYGNNGNRLSAETRVHYMVIKYVGTEREEVIQGDVTLHEPGDVGTLLSVEF